FESKSTFNLCETTPEDLQRFTLSHYGIPEPDSGTPRSNKHVRYLLGVLGLFMITITIWKLCKRSRRKKNEND
ncbi:MAG: hypothetical protein LBQ66_10505, partial [Planctomycetaceae bacterium]|nr:hypothetical protein [Planctomycetaceae bacterium]